MLNDSNSPNSLIVRDPADRKVCLCADVGHHPSALSDADALYVCGTPAALNVLYEQFPEARE